MIDDKYEHIRKIRSEFHASQKVKDGYNRALHILSEDLYNKDTHFIFELIQNAEDNTYRSAEPSLSFRLARTDITVSGGSGGVLIVQNNEIGFSSENVEAICDVGKTTKNKIQGYIGEKGIGFKSVFRITSCPCIFSSGYRFSLPEHDEETGLGYIVPKWIDNIPEGIDTSQTTIILPLDKPDFPYHRIEQMLRDIEPETIIFLSRLKEIRVQTDSGDAWAVLKDDNHLPHVQVMVEGAVKWKQYSNLDEFLVHHMEFVKPPHISHEKRHGIDKRDVSIAFPLNTNNKKTGKIFAYLPVRSDTGFPFLINADFILPSSREDILDNSWNRWLMSCVAELMGPALGLLNEKGELTVGLLDALAKKLLEITERDIFYPIALGAKQAFNNMALLPAVDETTVKAQYAKIARSSELRNLVGLDELKMLFQSSHAIKWLSAEITEDLTRDLWRYLTTQLGIEVVRPEKFFELLTADFLEKQSDEWIIEFYSFLDKDKTESWRRPDSVIKKRRIIRLEDNSHVLPFKSDGTPNAYLPSSVTTNFQTVKRVIFENENAVNFLKKLNIIEPDAFAEIIDSILPKYAKEPILVSREKNIDDLKKIAKAVREPFKGNASSLLAKLKILSGQLTWLSDMIERLKENSLEEDEEFIGALIRKSLRDILPSYLLLRASNGRKTEYKAPQQVYRKTEELLCYFQGNYQAWFICDDYPSELQSLFDALELDERPKIERRSADHSGHVIIENSHGDNKRGLNGFDPDIKVDGLEYAIASRTVEKSIYIWNNIALSNSDCIRGTMESSSKKTYEKSTTENQISEFGRMLIENAWLPTSNEGFLKPKDLFLVDLPPAFKKDEQLAKSLGMKQPEIEQALDLITGGDADLKILIEHYQSATDADRKRILQAIIPREITKEASPSFKDGLKNLVRSQVGSSERPNTGMSPVSNPDRYQEKLNERVEDKIQKHASSVRKITFRAVTHSVSNSEARCFLYEQYQGHCQITGTTFPKARPDPSENYFEACSLVSYGNAEYLNDPGNMLCVSADTMAKLKFASFEFVDNLEDEIEKFKADGGSAETVSVRIRLSGAECAIKWRQRHFMRLIALYDKA